MGIRDSNGRDNILALQDVASFTVTGDLARFGFHGNYMGSHCALDVCRGAVRVGATRWVGPGGEGWIGRSGVSQPMTIRSSTCPGGVIVLTGACGLIGRTLARALSERRARVIMVDTASAQPERLAQEFGDDAIGLACDVSSSAEVEKLAIEVDRRVGPVDVLINNHQHKPKGFAEAEAATFPEELWDAILDVNLKGTFLTCREFGRAMLRRGSGCIINVASTYGVVSSNPDLYETTAWESDRLLGEQGRCHHAYAISRRLLG